MRFVLFALLLAACGDDSGEILMPGCPGAQPAVGSACDTTSTCLYTPYHLGQPTGPTQICQCVSRAWSCMVAPDAAVDAPAHDASEVDAPSDAGSDGMD